MLRFFSLFCIYFPLLITPSFITSFYIPDFNSERFTGIVLNKKLLFSLLPVKLYLIIIVSILTNLSLVFIEKVVKNKNLRQKVTFRLAYFKSRHKALTEL